MILLLFVIINFFTSWLANAVTIGKANLGQLKNIQYAYAYVVKTNTNYNSKNTVNIFEIQNIKIKNQTNPKFRIKVLHNRHW